MSVPAIRLFGGHVGHARRQAFDGCETHAIGAWLPELEVTHYLATSTWRGLIEGAQACVVVSGNALVRFHSTKPAGICGLARCPAGMRIASTE